jgi:uncharacterized membrane protein
VEWLQSLGVASLWRALPVVVLAGSALFFGRTLQPGQVPLIERIARVSDPEFSEPMQRYTRRLTAIWAAYFVLAAVVYLSAGAPGPGTGAWVWLGAAVLFVGEHRLRPRFFPGRTFPGLAQQLRDTWRVWRPPKTAG